MDFVESGLHFYFDSSWVVKKYDAHRFFSGLAGAGLKGVDFIALKKDRLMIIEIKNYRRRQSWQTENPIDKVLEAPDQFAETIILKAEDSLRGTLAIGTYYKRKWLYKLMSPVLRFLPTNGWDFLFWIRASRLIQLPKKIHFILWMETETTRHPLQKVIQKQLTDGLHSRIAHVSINNSEQQSLPDDFWVEPVREELS